MIIKTFRVSPVGDCLELWIELPNNEENKSYYIDKIAIQSHDNFSELYPKEPEIELSTDATHNLKITNNRKVTKRLFFNDLDLKETGLYFLYVQLAKIPTEFDTSTTHPESPLISYAIHLSSLYNLVTENINEIMKQRCGADISYIADIYLKKSILEQSLQLKIYYVAIKLWDNIIAKDVEIGISKMLNYCDLDFISNNIAKSTVGLITGDSGSVCR